MRNILVNSFIFLFLICLVSASEENFSASIQKIENNQKKDPISDKNDRIMDSKFIVKTNIEKRSAAPRNYNFGIGKKFYPSYDLINYEPYNQITDDNAKIDYIYNDYDLKPKLRYTYDLVQKRVNPGRFGFGLGKRDGKDRFAFGLGKREGPLRKFEFGIGKRLAELDDEDEINGEILASESRQGRPIHFDFGLEKRDLNQGKIEEYMKRRYSFGIGKRLKKTRESRYGFGLGK